MRVAVLGAYGAIGCRLVAQAAASGHTVTAVGRDPVRLATVPAAHHVRLGVDDPGGVRALARTQDVLVNATGVEDPAVAVAATAGGAAYADISAEGDHLQSLRQLPRPRRPIAAGIGLAPGLTNLLAATAPGHSALHIGVVGGVGESHGEAGRRWIWEVAGRVVTSGGRPERVYRHVRRMRVPGLGHRHLLRAAFGEQDQLAADLGRPVSTWLALDPPWATPLLGVAGAAPRLAVHLDRLADPLAAPLGAYQRWGVVVTDDRGPVAWATGWQEVHATATVVTLSLEALHHAEPAVYAAHQLLDLEDLSPGLVSAGISVGTARH
jgi:hypothetical protein